jgi:hypothetical protein
MFRKASIILGLVLVSTISAQQQVNVTQVQQFLEDQLDQLYTTATSTHNNITQVKQEYL